MIKNQDLAFFKNGLTADFGYYNISKNKVEEKEKEFLKRTSMLIDSSYKDLLKQIEDLETKELFSSETQDGTPLLLTLVKGLFTKDGQIQTESKFCCSTYALKCGSDKVLLAKLAEKINSKKDSLFKNAVLTVKNNQAGICFELKIF